MVVSEENRKRAGVRNIEQTLKAERATMAGPGAMWMHRIRGCQVQPGTWIGLKERFE